MPKLKVFRTTIGFHDAFVAAPSRAAALRAWGSTTDLFAMGAAEEVSEVALMAKPLAEPGTIIKQSRGTAADHMAATTKGSPARNESDSSKAKPQKPKPLPSPQKLDAADKALADAEARFDRAKQDMDDEAARLAARRRTMEHEQRARIGGLRDERDREDEDYRRAVEHWRAEN